MVIKDPTFAMVAKTTSRPNNNGGYNNSYNQSSIRGRGRGNSNRGRGRGPTPNQFSQYSSNQAPGTRSERLTCQICGKVGHLAIDYWSRHLVFAMV